eukprot:jgi/Bigna1/76863/fgenesh1_pg.44_\
MDPFLLTSRQPAARKLTGVERVRGYEDTKKERSKNMPRKKKKFTALNKANAARQQDLETLKGFFSPSFSSEVIEAVFGQSEYRMEKAWKALEAMQSTSVKQEQFQRPPQKHQRHRDEKHSTTTSINTSTTTDHNQRRGDGMTKGVPAVPTNERRGDKEAEEENREECNSKKMKEEQVQMLREMFLESVPLEQIQLVYEQCGQQLTPCISLLIDIQADKERVAEQQHRRKVAVETNENNVRKEEKKGNDVDKGYEKEEKRRNQEDEAPIMPTIRAMKDTKHSPTKNEDNDASLALALHLQEEENERARARINQNKEKNKKVNNKNNKVVQGRRTPVEADFHNKVVVYGPVRQMEVEVGNHEVVVEIQYMEATKRLCREIQSPEYQVSHTIVEEAFMDAGRNYEVALLWLCRYYPNAEAKKKARALKGKQSAPLVDFNKDTDKEEKETKADADERPHAAELRNFILANLGASTITSRENPQKVYNLYRSNIHDLRKQRDKILNKAAGSAGHKQKGTVTGALAVVLDEVVRLIRKKIRRAELEAIKGIYLFTNRGRDNSRSVDLHGLHVNESIKVAARLFSQSICPSDKLSAKVLRILLTIAGKGEYRVVTGIGQHSCGQARLRPAMERFVNGLGFKCAQEKPGVLRVILHEAIVR